jgi:hypothetical protein
LNIILGIILTLVFLKIMMDDIREKSSLATFLNVIPILAFWFLGVFNIFNLWSLYNYLIFLFLTILSVATILYFKLVS